MLVPSIIQFMAHRYLLLLQDRGIRIEASGMQGLRFGISAESIQAWVPVPLATAPKRSFPLVIELHQAQGRLRIPLLTPWRLKAALSAQGYGGGISGEVAQLFSRPTIDIDIAQLALGEHPQLSAVGIESGTVSLEVRGHPMQPILPTNASYKISARDLEIRPPPIVQNLARISTVSGGALEGSATIESSGRFNIPSCSFRSSLGDVGLSARGTLTETLGLDTLSGTLRVNLSGSDSDKLAQWIPVLTQQQVAAATKSFTCALRSADCQGGQGLQVRLGARCVRLACS